MDRISIKFFSTIFIVCLLFSNAESQDMSIFKLDKSGASKLIEEMASTGNLSNRLHAQAWVVLATISLGAGLDHCDFPKQENNRFLFEPATDGLSEDDIFVLNRFVTKNYRESEDSGKIDFQKLYNVTKAAIQFISIGTMPTGKSKIEWDCRSVYTIWEVSSNYQNNKNR